MWCFIRQWSALISVITTITTLFSDVELEHTFLPPSISRRQHLCRNHQEEEEDITFGHTCLFVKQLFRPSFLPIDHQMDRFCCRQLRSLVQIYFYPQLLSLLFFFLFSSPLLFFLLIWLPLLVCCFCRWRSPQLLLLTVLSLSLLCFAVFSGCRACCLQSADNNISVSPQTLNEVDVYAVRAYYIFPCSLFCRHLNSTSTAQRKRVKVFVLLCLPVNVVVPYRIKYIFYYYTASLQHILLLTTCKVDDTLFFCCDRIITFFFTLPKQLTSLTTFLLLVRRSIDITKPTCQSAKTHTKTHSTGWFAICNNNNCVCMYFSMWQSVHRLTALFFYLPLILFLSEHISLQFTPSTTAHSHTSVW